jgi:hypothetical protein
MIDKPFDVALAEYMTFKAKASAIVDHRVPTEVTQLKLERQNLEPLLARAWDWYADATGYYYKAKSRLMDQWVLDGKAVSVATEAAKTRAFKELWLKTDAEGTLEKVKSRKYEVRDTLEKMGLI